MDALTLASHARLQAALRAGALEALVATLEWLGSEPWAPAAAAAAGNFLANTCAAIASLAKREPAARAALAGSGSSGDGDRAASWAPAAAALRARLPGGKTVAALHAVSEAAELLRG